uniref:Thioredoxin domain-containing protein n=1 Tax=Odontella aurita TaxID=265563 RepID=A0A7S4J1B5_9STRA|mmetsp:Transcript_35608/g.106261  ORF Transcript_35608/g.106261 Transcript_35608/m.106261 type:complete len:107 (+) Transcript_35608:150-470(+)
MMRLAVFLAFALASVTAFTTPFLGSSSRTLTAARRPASRQGALSMRVVDIDSPEAFDKTIESAGSSLVVVDYSTTWCGPCKVIAPKFDEFSDQYPDAVFLKVSGMH